MKKDNDAKKRILASLVMGLNCVNSFAPMAMVVNVQPESATAKPAKETIAEPEQYTAACYQALNVVDSAIFGTAEAAFTQVVGGTGAVTSVNGETVEVSAGVSIQTIYSDGIATGGIINSNGIQIVSGGTATVTTMNGGRQVVDEGGTGVVETIHNGSQVIASDGIGNITTINAGDQVVTLGGAGTITTMNSGASQDIRSGATGTLTTMNGGIQSINGTGTITTMNGGTQNNLGTGTVTTMNGGTQIAYAGGTATVATMSGGTQTVWAHGSGSIDTMMSNGNQIIKSGGTGAVITMMSSGYQFIDSGGTGTVITMNDGAQWTDGTGTITTMNGGTHTIRPGGIATVTTMNGGNQFPFGTATIDTMNDGGQVVQMGGTGTVTTMNSGRQAIMPGGTGIVDTMNGGYQQILCVGRINELNNGIQLVDSGGTSLNTSVTGGTMIIHPDATTVVENVTLNAGTIAVRDPFINDYEIKGNFVANGGTVGLEATAAISMGILTVNLHKPTTPKTLTIDNLKGNGTTFVMYTDINSETNGDKLVIQAADPNAGGSIQAYDRSLVDGTNVVGPKKLLVVTDNSGVTTWTGKTLDTGGLWTITPNIIKEGNNWYLYLTDNPTSPNGVAKTNIGFTNAAYGAWRNAIMDDTLRMRLGDLHYNDAEDGVWARAKAGKMDASGFTGSYQMYQVGMDKKLANTVYGVAVDHMIGSNDYLDGNGKNSMTNLSLYATNYHPSGVYSDVVVKAGKYRSDLNVNSTNDAADYNAWGYSASYEIGKTIAKENGFFIEPEAQFILGKLQGADYTSNNRISINGDGSTSFLGRLGFVAGRKLSNAGDYYFKASVWREFAGSGDINLSAINNAGDKERMMDNFDHKDTWFELGLGGNVKLAKMTHLYGDVVKTFGADIQKKWQVNAGVRWEF